MTTTWQPILCAVWHKPHIVGGKYNSIHTVTAPLSTPCPCCGLHIGLTTHRGLRCLPQLPAVFICSLFCTSQPIHPYFMLRQRINTRAEIKERTIVTWTDWSNGNALDFAVGRCLLQILARTPASLTEVSVSSVYPGKCQDIAPARPQPHLSKSFSIRHSSVISPSDTTLSKINKKLKYSQQRAP